MTFRIRTIGLAALTSAVFAASWPTSSLAEERLASGMTARKIYIKSEKLAVTLPTEAFLTPTVVTCPKGGACTLRVDYTSVVALMSGSPSGYMSLTLWIDGEPSETVLFEYAPGNGVAGTRSFTFMLPGVAPGDHTLELTPGGQYGAGSWVGSRTLVVEVLKP
jgi:hypothetical protein